MKPIVMFALVLGLIMPAEAQAKVPAQQREMPFSQGKFRVSVGGGTSFRGGGFTLAAGFGYFVIDGLEVGLDGDIWLGGDILYGSLAPQVRYLLPYLYPVIPYVGVFYRHTFIEDPYTDQDHLGGKVGMLVSVADRFMLGGGIVMEYALTGCGQACFDYYPELAFNITF